MWKSRQTIRLEWANKIESWKQSGKSAQAWCQENQIVYSTFLGWCRRFHISFPIKKNPKSREPENFIELKERITVGSEISLEYSGLIMHLKGEFDFALLEKCIALLRGIAC
jgi:hypothetical protein